MEGFLVGRKRVDIEYKGIILCFEDGKKVIRVGRDVKKNQGIINYKLVETSLKNKKTKEIYQSTSLDKIASEFSKYILLAQNRNSLEIAPDSLFIADEIEVSIKWFDIKDRSVDEATIKYIANFLDGLDGSYFESLEKTHNNFKYDYYYLYSNELVPYLSRSYKAFSEVAEYLEDYPNCDQAVLPAIARTKDDKAFAFFAFDDEDSKRKIKKDIVRLCNQHLDKYNNWAIEGLKDAFEKQVVDMTAQLEDGYSSCKRKMELSLEAKKQKYLEAIPAAKIISLETRNDKEVETHEEFIEYIDNLVDQYGTGVENLKLNLANDLKKHYLDGKPKNEKLRITVGDFYDKTNKYYIKRAIECIAKRDQRELKELKELLSHRVKFEKYTKQYYSNIRFKLLGNGAIIKFKQHISKDFIIKEFCQILKKDPEFVIIITGDDDFKQLSEKLNQRKLTLDHLWGYYHNRDKYTDQKKLSDNWIKRNHAWLVEFKKITGIHEIKDITADTINKYHQELNKVVAGNYYPSWLSSATKKTLRKKSASKKWVSHRVEFICSLFQNAIMVNHDDLQLRQTLEYLK